jgi:hypothetical protein
VSLWQATDAVQHVYQLHDLAATHSKVRFERDGVILAPEVVGAINEAEILARSGRPDAGQTVPRWEPLGG